LHKREGRELEKDRYTWCRGCSSLAKGSTKTCTAGRGAHLSHRKEVALGAVDPDTRAGRGSAWEILITVIFRRYIAHLQLVK